MTADNPARLTSLVALARALVTPQAKTIALKPDSRLTVAVGGQLYELAITVQTVFKSGSMFAVTADGEKVFDVPADALNTYVVQPFQKVGSVMVDVPPGGTATLSLVTR